MFDPSMLAPLVTITLVQAWVSMLLTENIAAVNVKMAVESLLILYFY